MKIGYLVSCYPSVSHTFIRREADALRRRNLTIETFSIRSPDIKLLRADADLEEARTTKYVLKASWLSFAEACVACVFKRSRKLTRAVPLAVSLRAPGLRGWLWSVFHLCEAMWLAAELKRRRIVHLHSHFSNSGATVGLLAAKLAGVSWSVTLHGSADFDSPSTTPTLSKRINLAEFVVCVSEYGRRLAIEIGGPQSAQKIIVARCGIDLARFEFRGRHRRAGPITIVTVGRLSPEKAHTGLVDAFVRFRQRANVDATLVIVGEGPERSRLEAQIALHRIQSFVMLPGSASEDEVAQILSGADLFVLSSKIEGLPVVLMEAMAIGVPVVAPNLAGIPELVEDGVCGRLFEPGNWEELAEVMADTLANVDIQESFVAVGRRAIETTYEINRAVEPLHKMFRATLDRARDELSAG